MSGLGKIIAKRSVSFEASPVSTISYTEMSGPIAQRLRTIQAQKNNQLLKGYFLRGNSPLKPRVATKLDMSPPKNLASDLNKINTKLIRPNLFRKGLYSESPNKRKETQNFAQVTLNSALSDELTDSVSRLQTGSPVLGNETVDSPPILSKKQYTRPGSTSISPMPFGSEISTTSGASEKLLISSNISMTIQKNPSGVSVITEVQELKEKTEISRSELNVGKTAENKIDANELKRAYYEKLKFVRESKKSSDETHEKFMAKLKILHKVAWKIDALHRSVYDKISKKKFFEKVDGDDEGPSKNEQGFRGYQHINDYFNHEIKQFISRKNTEQKVREKISKSSVQNYLTNLLTAQSAIIKKAMNDKHEDIAAMMLMLIEINVLEFEDVLASYVINLDLEHQTIEDSAKTEAAVLRKKLKQREERFKFELQRNQGNIELVNRKTERYAEKRRELERLLMDKNHHERQGV